MSTRGSIRLATRGSDLALRQAAGVKAALEERRYEVDLVEVETRGDELRDELIHRLGKTGAFVRSLDEKVLAGEVDAAVHSMKDVPTESPDDLVVAAVPERAAPYDVLVTPDGASLEDLPEGATVGTASLRRRAQLLAERPDLTVSPLRGNVDTRVEKLLAPHRQREHQRRIEAAGETPEDADGRDGNGDDGDGIEDEIRAGDETAEDDAGQDGDADPKPTREQSVEEWFASLSAIERQALEREVDVEYDAVVLAEAGLERSGLAASVAFRRLPVERFVPAPGQGALAVTALDDDLGAALHDVLDHPRTRVETTVERAVLAELGGGCVAPLGVYAVLQGEYVHARAAVLDRDGDDAVTATRDLPVERHLAAATEFAGDLADRGARELVRTAKRAADENAAKRGS